MRKNYSTGLAMEEQIGFSRAVQVGPVLYVSATAPVDDDLNLVGTTGYEQAVYVFDKQRKLLAEAGFSFADVTFVRLYFCAGEQSEDAYRAFTEIFGEIRPAIAVVNVTPWSISGMLLEIELVAHKTA